MNFEQAREYSFLVKWKTTECFSGPDCWCRIILPIEPIYYVNPESPDVKHEYGIVDAGSLDQETAEYIVKLHNEYIQNKNIIDSLKNEIKIQRKEIAGLREERKFLLDKDLPPGYTKL